MSSSNLIKRRVPSKRNMVYEDQAKHLADLIDFLEKQACAHFRVRTIESADKNRFREFRELDAYKLFLIGSYACGFVMRDGKPENPLLLTPGRPADSIEHADFPTVRQIVHFLLRAERWADGYNSPILDALIDGLLPAISRRLRFENGLYEPV